MHLIAKIAELHEYGKPRKNIIKLYINLLKQSPTQTVKLQHNIITMTARQQFIVQYLPRY